MLTFLLAASFAATPAAPTYISHSVHAFVAVANERIVDGVAYTDGNGAVSGGLLYAHPSGFFASTEASAFDGDGTVLPRKQLASLETAAGWQWQLAEQQFAVALLDYRLRDSTTYAHRGLALSYRTGGLGLELGQERDKAFFVDSYSFRGFRRYDLRRAAISWEQPLGDQLSWYVNAGALWVSRFDRQHRFGSAGLRTRWRGFDWQLGVTVTSDELQDLYGETTAGTHVLLRVSRSFRLD